MPLTKKRRIGPLLLERAGAEHAYTASHAFLGGTGAVGGAALLQMLAFYEEMFSLRRPNPRQVPVLLATGRSEDDIRAFTSRLFRTLETRYGEKSPLDKFHSGYLTPGGVYVALDRLAITLLPELEGAKHLKRADKEQAVALALDALRIRTGLATGTVSSLLEAAISAARPVSSFLASYAAKHLKDSGGRFMSVTIGIPIPSLITYHHDAFDVLAEIEPSVSAELAHLKESFIASVRHDLAAVKDNMTDVFMIAHTTGVGGMYDEYGTAKGTKTTVRLGFAHAAQDKVLAEKHLNAKSLGELYSEEGFLVLVTAAAIGIDEVRIADRIPLHQKVAQELFDAPREIFPGSKDLLPAAAKASQRAGRPVPARQFVRVHEPLSLPLYSRPRSSPLTFPAGTELRPKYSIRSGENGFFSVANAEALYRTMRVASASELGALLATVGLFGDDPNVPWFTNSVCYYTETDYSRQVFDFLRLPALLECQLSGLEPMALQDLGSSKHQGELHMLGLLVLLHRLHTLDVDAIDPYVDPARFDHVRFFIDHSRPLTFEDVETWEIQEIANDLRVLVTAQKWRDLFRLKAAPSREGLFPHRDQAFQTILEAVLNAVWAVPSLGSPLVYSEDGEDRVRIGYFAGPLGLLLSDTDSLSNWFHDQHAAVKDSSSIAEFIDFHVCDRGFIDVRPHAILSTARASDEQLSKKVVRFGHESEFRSALSQVLPYSYFSTCGLLAVVVRLRALYRTLREAVIELGTAPEFRWQMPRDERGHTLLLPGACEAFRLVSEGLEKTTGLERLDGMWGYERQSRLDRRAEIKAYLDETALTGRLQLAVDSIMYAGRNLGPKTQ
jgi:hypothetical protein